jgi:uncharacterized protein YciI
MAGATPNGDAAPRRHLGKLLWVIFSEPTSSAEERRKVHHEHLAHQYDLEARGILFAAGPFLDADDKPRGPGLIIIRADSEAEARAIADADPYHRGGYRTYRLERWKLSEGSLGIRLALSNTSFTID